MSEIIEKYAPSVGERYFYTRHSSGLDVYLVPKKMSTAYAAIGVKYGSLNDRFKRTGAAEFIEVPAGIAHFLEHKMFENEDGTDTFEKFASLGAESNAYTTFDKTVYLFSCSDNFGASLRELFDYVTHPYFTEENVKKEQGIIAQEIRMGDDSPGRALTFGMLKSLYGSCRVRNEVAGTVESIAGITPELLYDCYETFYNLNNMALCVSGDVTMEEILSCADKCLKPAEPFDAVTDVPEEQGPAVRERFSRRMQVASPLFAIGIKNSFISPDPRERMKQSAAVSVITDMLFGKSSPFFNGLYEKGAVNGSVDIWSEHNREFSFVCLSGEGDDPERVYSDFLRTVDRALENGLDEKAFTRCKRVMYSGFVSSFDSTDDIANDFIDFLFDGGDMLDYSDICSSLDIGYAEGIMKELFKKDRFTLASILPYEKEGN